MTSVTRFLVATVLPPPLPTRARIAKGRREGLRSESPPLKRHWGRVYRLGASDSNESSTEEPPVVYNKDFGYSRKDVLLIGVGTIGLGYGLYYGLQFAGMEELQAGSVAELIVFLGILMTWVVTYLFRVGSKTTTYVTQLQDYEEAVMEKRLEEMTDAEIEIMMAEVEREKREAADRDLDSNERLS